MSQDSSDLVIEPNRIYNQTECGQILQVSPNTLVKLRRERGFPIRDIGGPRALGADILEWLKQQPDKEYVPRPSRRKK